MNTRDAVGGKGRAPTLYAIIVLKLGKGLLLVLLALGVLSLVQVSNLDLQFDRLLRWVHLDPENQFFAALGERVGHLTRTNIGWVASGTFLYGLLCLIEGAGLIWRVSWIGWIAIGESAFFIPIEVYHLVQHFTAMITAILVVNVVIVWYLMENRQRLFKHHHHAH